ncbi:CO/xanthine dehydrogenase FAD-binding subunit [Bradyrhizobium sp. LM6.11]
MTVTVKTFTSSSEAAAALSSDRNARYLGGGTLVMRALNEGDISLSTVVRANDQALTRIEPSGPRITLGAGVTFARILGERDLAFPTRPCPLDWWPGGPQHGYGGWQSVRAQSLW